MGAPPSSSLAPSPLPVLRFFGFRLPALPRRCAGQWASHVVALVGRAEAEREAAVAEAGRKRRSPLAGLLVERCEGGRAARAVLRCAVFAGVVHVQGALDGLLFQLCSYAITGPEDKARRDALARAQQFVSAPSAWAWLWRGPVLAGPPQARRRGTALFAICKRRTRQTDASACSRRQCRLNQRDGMSLMPGGRREQPSLLLG